MHNLFIMTSFSVVVAGILLCLAYRISKRTHLRRLQCRGIIAGIQTYILYLAQEGRSEDLKTAQLLAVYAEALRLRHLPDDNVRPALVWIAAVSGGFEPALMIAANLSD